MIELKNGLFLYSNEEPGGKFKRIIETWDDIAGVNLYQPEKTLIVPGKTLSDFGLESVLKDVSELFGNGEVIIRSDGNFEDDKRRSAGVLESVVALNTDDRLNAILKVCKSMESPKAKAYIEKHAIEDPRMGIGIQSLVSGRAFNLISGVVNSAYKTRIEVTMVEGFGGKLNSYNHDPRFRVTYNRDSKTYEFEQDADTVDLSIDGPDEADQQRFENIKNAGKNIIDRILELEKKWGLSGKQGIDLEFVVPRTEYPEYAIHVQNNLIPIPGDYTLPDNLGEKIVDSDTVIGHGLIETEDMLNIKYRGQPVFQVRERIKEYNDTHKDYVLFISESFVKREGTSEYSPNPESNCIDYELIYNAAAVVIYGTLKCLGDMSQHFSLLARCDGIKIMTHRTEEPLDFVDKLDENCTYPGGYARLPLVVACNQEKKKAEIFLKK